MLGDSATAIVTAVSQSQTHTFSKANQTSIQLMTGVGVLGDAHLGVTVKHRSRVAQDPTQPNHSTEQDEGQKRQMQFYQKVF